MICSYMIITQCSKIKQSVGLSVSRDICSNCQFRCRL